MKRQGMHSARLEKSPRLQRVAAYLGCKGWRSTRDIMLHAEVCAVNSCVAELRQNGFDIEFAWRSGLPMYRLNGGE